LISFSGRIDMNDVINASQPASARDCVKRAGQDQSTQNANHTVPAHSATNWAWSTPTSQYDWMDSHAPFSSLD
jgi:hypothetical protein